MRRFFLPTLSALCLIVALAVAQSTRVGPVASVDSLSVNQRVGRTGETITQAAGGSNKERVRRGNCYFAVGAAGVAPGTTIGTTAALVVYNPQNSGVLTVIRKVYCTYASGTLGTGTLLHCLNGTPTQTAPSGGTTLAAIPALGGGPSNAVSVIRTGATVVAPSILAPFAYMAPELATTVTAPQQTVEDMDDSIQLLPGTSYQLQGSAAAGTSPIVVPAVFWEEQTLLNGQP